MKLDCVVAACNMNPLYYGFIPMFVKAWTKLYPDVDVKIVLINESLPAELQDYKDNIILFEPLPKISTAFISQYIRLLYPCILNYKNGIMITDMDIMPMNSKYYTENIKDIDDDKFVYYRNVLMQEYNEIAMCYNVATSKTWSEIFNINSIDDINKRLVDVYNNINYVDGHGQNGWTTDQKDLYKYVMEWNQKTGNYIYLNDWETGFSRLDRIAFNFNDDKIKNGFYSDYHCLRPYKTYKLINDKIVSLL